MYILLLSGQWLRHPLLSFPVLVFCLVEMLNPGLRRPIQTLLWVPMLSRVVGFYFLSLPTFVKFSCTPIGRKCSNPPHRMSAPMAMEIGLLKIRVKNPETMRLAMGQCLGDGFVWLTYLDISNSYFSMDTGLAIQFLLARNGDVWQTLDKMGHRVYRRRRYKHGRFRGKFHLRQSYKYLILDCWQKNLFLTKKWVGLKLRFGPVFRFLTKLSAFTKSSVFDQYMNFDQYFLAAISIFNQTL